MSQKKKIKTQLKFKKNIILNVGRLTEQKNQLLLLKAFKRINQINKKINLLLIGSGPQKKVIKEYIKKNNLNNNVQLLTNINNSLPYIKLSDLYVSTSQYEGFPNIIIESLVLNKPIISTYFKSGLSEILLNGKGGVIIKKDFIENLSSQVLFFFKNRKYYKLKTILAKDKLDRFSFKKGKLKFLKIIDNI